jgi:choline dehydrogenase-like flavoprotein
MRDYVHWATLGALCEYLPLADNRVTLDEEKDRYGLPVAHFSYSLCDNDKQLLDAARGKQREILEAAGATEVIAIDRAAHLVGGARMSATPEDGVVDSTLRTWAIANLYVVDGSVLPTQGSANPALTIMALSARAADVLREGQRSGLGPVAARR